MYVWRAMAMVPLLVPIQRVQRSSVSEVARVNEKEKRDGELTRANYASGTTACNSGEGG